MGRPEQIESLEDVKHWIYDHDGRIDAWWEAQHEWNAKKEILDASFEKRLSAVERRMAAVSAAAAAIGAVAGTMLSKWLA